MKPSAAAVAALVLSAVRLLADDKPAAIDALLKRYQEVGSFNGSALVAENGKVIFKKGFGLADFEWKIPNATDTKFRLASITKQFTATVVVKLVEDGTLKLDTTLADALPYYRKDTGAKVTIHQLLNHTSGIPSYTGLPGFFKDVSRDPYGVKDFVLKYCSGDLEFEPGSKFEYNNSAYFLLGAIVEQVTGKAYAVVVKERIFDPLGMRSSGYDLGDLVIERRAHGYERTLSGVRNANYLDMSLPFSAGALFSTVEDLYLWDQALYGNKVLPQAAQELMFTPGLESYAYGWQVDKRPIGPAKAERRIVWHGGGINGFNTRISRIPDERHLVVLLNNTGGTNLEGIFSAIADILYGRTPPPVKESVALLLMETIDKKGVPAAVARYRELKAGKDEHFDLTETQLNGLGYELLSRNRTADAIEVFRLNVEAFPESANVYDSLGEAYAKAGQKDEAIKSYARSLERNPGSQNAIKQLGALSKP